jgi:hypothetical protein
MSTAGTPSFHKNHAVQRCPWQAPSIVFTCDSALFGTTACYAAPLALCTAICWHSVQLHILYRLPSSATNSSHHFRETPFVSIVFEWPK